MDGVRLALSTIIKDSIRVKRPIPTLNFRVDQFSAERYTGSVPEDPAASQEGSIL